MVSQGGQTYIQYIVYVAKKLDLRFRGCELQFSIENFYAKP